MNDAATPLRRLALLGGMSWQSTALYYRQLNESVNARVGGHASAPVTIHSVDFGPMEAMQQAGDWPAPGRCTEIGLLVSPADAAVPVLDTTTLHCTALTEFILTGTTGDRA